MLMDATSTAGGALDGVTAARRAVLVVVAPGALEAEWVSRRPAGDILVSIEWAYVVWVVWVVWGVVWFNRG
jgi:hypothetical protein